MIYKIQVKRIGKRVISRYERVAHTSAKTVVFGGCKIAIVDFATDMDLSDVYSAKSSELQKTVLACQIDKAKRT